MEQNPEGDTPNGDISEPVPGPISLEEFLKNRPPGAWSRIGNLAIGSGNVTLCIPALDLNCPECKGTRLFEPGYRSLAVPARRPLELPFQCRNCVKARKVYVVIASDSEEVAIDDPTRGSFPLPANGPVFLYKLAEVPEFGGSVAPRLRRLLGREWHLWVKGWGDEKQGKGIGAFSYYRRVVEHRKKGLFDLLIRAAEKTSADADLVAELRAAREERQFGDAVKGIKHGFPAALLIQAITLSCCYTAL